MALDRCLFITKPVAVSKDLLIWDATFALDSGQGSRSKNGMPSWSLLNPSLKKLMVRLKPLCVVNAPALIQVVSHCSVCKRGAATVIPGATFYSFLSMQVQFYHRKT
jgi:hypothetical protein